ncbi:MAG: ribosome maturation protein SDO1 [Candidatus Micrarchaeota archaeon]|nr:MAG: ribosome maturation protein SDO1 [Candidatus Micrarchaeota archaeon]
MSGNKILIATYKHNNEIFQIIVNADLAYDYINGKINDPLSVLEDENIFKDAKKGEVQSEAKIKAAFGTTDIAKVVDTILKKGEVPLTAEQRAKMLEQKENEIINIIASNSIDPRTKTPIPPLRIKNAMQQARVGIDVNKSAEEQIDRIVKELSKVLPIKFAKVKLDILLPADIAGRSLGYIKSNLTILKQEWLNDGSLKIEGELPAGLRDEFISKLGNITAGKANVKIIE